MTNSREHVLLGHLAAFGDCLCASTLTRQIKQDHPGCHLTWAIARPYRQVAEQNPFVDEIWELPITGKEAASSGWKLFVREARRRKQRGDFDRLYLTQVPPDNYGRFDGTVRASILNGYPNPITVPIAPIVRLSPEEIRRVDEFVRSHSLDAGKRMVLFECAAYSGQSFVTPDFALRVARLVLAGVPEARIVLSSDSPVTDPDARIIDGSVLRFKENAELLKFASLFVGSYSGITWLAVSDWAPPLPTIQFIRRTASVFSSLRADALHFGLPADQIIEVTDCSPEHAASCIIMALTAPIDKVRECYHESIEADHTFYLTTFFLPFLKRGHIFSAIRSLVRVIRRFGWKSVRRTFHSVFQEL